MYMNNLCNGNDRSKWYLMLCICYYYIPVSVYRLFLHKRHSPASPTITVQYTILTIYNI